MRAAIAKSADESDWEHELLRRRGIGALQVFRDGKAVWDSAAIFNDELTEAQREGAAEAFQAQNELDGGLLRAARSRLARPLVPARLPRREPMQ